MISHKMPSSRIHLLAALLTVWLLSGCGMLYTPEVQQGNVITQEMLDTLKPGMTPRQVRFVLGSPLVQDPFHPWRWDYFFYHKKDNDRPTERRRVTVFFEKEKLQRIEVEPQAKPGENLIIQPQIHDGGN